MGKGRAPCCDKSKVKQGPWTPSEDLRLTTFIHKHGHSNWRALPKLAGLMRCGKSCRLRWINYLRPDVKRGNFTPEEEQTIINLHSSFGNKWSKIASHLPGRTDNEIKNVWNTHLKKRLLVTNHKNIINNSEAFSTTSTTSIASSIDDPQDNRNTQIKVQEPNQAMIDKQNNEPTNPCIIEAKEQAVVSSDSPTSSSYASSWISDIEKIEIPLDFDVDFSQFFDSMDRDLQSNDHQIDLVEVSELEQSNWLRFVENELGLTSDEDFENNLGKEPQFDHEDYSLASDGYFPLWP